MDAIAPPGLGPDPDPDPGPGPGPIVPSPAPEPPGEAAREPVFVNPARLMPPRAAKPPEHIGSRIGWRTGIALGILAFLAGLGAMALIAVRYGASFGADASKPVATVTLPVGPGGQSPVLIMPGKTATIPTIDLAALSGREATLTARIAELEARGTAIDQSSAQASGYATRAEGLMIAFAARRALDRGLNLGYLEQQLRGRFGASQPRAVATIAQAAREPVTLEDLRAALDGVAPELMTGAASTGWWQSFNREIGNLVVLRRAGTPSPLPIDRVARARRLIEAGQVEAALSEVARTPGAAGAERWTVAARRYIAARAALDTIEATAIQTPIAPRVGSPAAAPASVPQTDVPGLGATPPNPAPVAR